MFSSVRNGYYNEQQRIRRASQRLIINRNKISLPDEPIDEVNRLCNAQKK